MNEDYFSGFWIILSINIKLVWIIIYKYVMYMYSIWLFFSHVHCIIRMQITSNRKKGNSLYINYKDKEKVAPHQSPISLFSFTSCPGKAFLRKKIFFIGCLWLRRDNSWVGWLILSGKIVKVELCLKASCENQDIFWISHKE